MNEEKYNNLKRADLINEINEVQSALSDSYKNLQLASEDGLLDYYAYKIKSEESLHKYLLDELKNMEN